MGDASFVDTRHHVSEAFTLSIIAGDLTVTVNSACPPIASKFKLEDDIAYSISTGGFSHAKNKKERKKQKKNVFFIGVNL